jgi:hypothetical protein
MSSTLPPNQPDDEIVSAVLDGSATDDQRALVAGDPSAQRRLHDFEQVRAGLAASRAPEPWAEAALAAALDTFGTLAPVGRPGPLVTATPVTGIGSPRAVRSLRVLGGLAAAAAVIVGIVVMGSHRSSSQKTADASAKAGLETNAARSAGATTAAASATTAIAAQAALADSAATASGAAAGAGSPSGVAAQLPATAPRPGPTAAAVATSAAGAATTTTPATSSPAASATTGPPEVIDDPAALRAWVAAHPASPSDAPLPCESAVTGARPVGRVSYQGTIVQVLTIEPRIVALDDTTCQTVVDLAS